MFNTAIRKSPSISFVLNMDLKPVDHRYLGTLAHFQETMAGKSKSGFGFKSGFSHFAKSSGFGFGLETIGFGFGFKHLTRFGFGS